MLNLQVHGANKATEEMRNFVSHVGSYGICSLRDFDLLETLGKGAFGVVQRVRSRSTKGTITAGTEYVIKQLKINKMTFRDREAVTTEVRLLDSLRSPFIIRFFDAFVEGDNLYLVLEIASKGTLLDCMRAYKSNARRLPERLIWKFFLEMAIGLVHIHYHGAIHRDIKPQNVFVGEDGSVKIGDLGVAQIKVTEGARRVQMPWTGTPAYLSPEIVANMPFNEKSDVWALGVLLYELCTFRLPFRGKNRSQLFREIENGAFKPLPSCYSADLTRVLEVCLRTDIEARPYLTELLRSELLSAKLEEFGLSRALTEASSSGKSLIQRKGSAGKARSGNARPPSSDPSIVYSAAYRKELREAALARREEEYRNRHHRGQAALQKRNEDYERLARIGSASVRRPIASQNLDVPSEAEDERQQDLEEHKGPIEEDGKSVKNTDDKHHEAVPTTKTTQLAEKVVNAPPQDLSPWNSLKSTQHERGEVSASSARRDKEDSKSQRAFSHRRREEPRFLMGPGGGYEAQRKEAAPSSKRIAKGSSDRETLAANSQTPASARQDSSPGSSPALQALSKERSRLRTLAIDADRRRMKAEGWRRDAVAALGRLAAAEGPPPSLVHQLEEEVETATVELRKAESTCADAWEQVAAVEHHYKSKSKGPSQPRKASLGYPRSSVQGQAADDTSKQAPGDVDEAELAGLPMHYQAQFFEMRDRLKSCRDHPPQYASDGDAEASQRRQNRDNSTGNADMRSHSSLQRPAKKVVTGSVRHGGQQAKSHSKPAPPKKITLQEALERQKMAGFKHYDANGKPLTYVKGRPTFGAFAPPRPLRALKVASSDR